MFNQKGQCPGTIPGYHVVHHHQSSSSIIIRSFKSQTNYKLFNLQPQKNLSPKGHMPQTRDLLDLGLVHNPSESVVTPIIRHKFRQICLTPPHEGP
jgi:hypothetical protein